MPAPKSIDHDSFRHKLDHSVALLREVERDLSPAVLATSFGVEGVALIHLIAQHAAGIQIFTIDTGRLPQETHEVAQRIHEQYGTRIRYYLPDTGEVESFVSEQGINAFFQNEQLRKRCCEIRKVNPLDRALAGKKAWLAGLRREQSATRAQRREREWDEDRNLYKFYPLLEWTSTEVWSFVRDNNIPYNRLYDRGYASIGCISCTRPITAGEDLRAGRWWWENDNTKECGIHLKRERPAEDWSI